jgi:hypothetical protein
MTAVCSSSSLVLDLAWSLGTRRKENAAYGAAFVGADFKPTLLTVMIW